MPRFFPLAILFLAALPASVVVGQNYPVDGTLIVQERYPEILRLLPLTCPPPPTPIRPILFPGTPLPPFDPDPTLTPLNPRKVPYPRRLGLRPPTLPNTTRTEISLLFGKPLTISMVRPCNIRLKLPLLQSTIHPSLQVPLLLAANFDLMKTKALSVRLLSMTRIPRRSNQTKLLRLDINGSSGTYLTQISSQRMPPENTTLSHSSTHQFASQLRSCPETPTPLN